MSVACYRVLGNLGGGSGQSNPSYRHGGQLMEKSKSISYLNIENTMVARVISEHKEISKLKMFLETGP